MFDFTLPQKELIKLQFEYNSLLEYNNFDFRLRLAEDYLFKCNAINKVGDNMFLLYELGENLCALGIGVRLDVVGLYVTLNHYKLYSNYEVYKEYPTIFNKRLQFIENVKNNLLELVYV
jgi:hypothetical protein